MTALAPQAPPAHVARDVFRGMLRLWVILLPACTALGGDAPGVGGAATPGEPVGTAPSSPTGPASPPPAPPVAPAPPALITDAECLARGGEIWTEQTWAHLDRRRDPTETRRPFRVCHVPSPKNGAACAGEADCAGGRCWCDGALSRPDPQRDPALLALDGQPATGRCSDLPIPSGEWRCLVVGGKAVIHGIIVD